MRDLAAYEAPWRSDGLGGEGEILRPPLEDPQRLGSTEGFT